MCHVPEESYGRETALCPLLALAPTHAMPPPGVPRLALHEVEERRRRRRQEERREVPAPKAQNKTATKCSAAWASLASQPGGPSRPAAWAAPAAAAPERRPDSPRRTLSVPADNDFGAGGGFAGEWRWKRGEDNRGSTSQRGPDVRQERNRRRKARGASHDIEVSNRPANVQAPRDGAVPWPKRRERKPSLSQLIVQESELQAIRTQNGVLSPELRPKGLSPRARRRAVLGCRAATRIQRVWRRRHDMRFAAVAASATAEAAATSASVSIVRPLPISPGSGLPAVPPNWQVSHTAAQKRRATSYLLLLCLATASSPAHFHPAGDATGQRRGLLPPHVGAAVALSPRGAYVRGDAAGWRRRLAFSKPAEATPPHRRQPPQAPGESAAMAGRAARASVTCDGAPAGREPAS